MEGVVSIVRADGAPVVKLWDGRRALPKKPLKVWVNEAADLIQREPDEWIVPIPSERELVNAELERRAEAAAAPAEEADIASADAIDRSE
jgi:hypothetical protein